jgi:hypothetical protein
MIRDRIVNVAGDALRLQVDTQRIAARSTDDIKVCHIVFALGWQTA